MRAGWLALAGGVCVIVLAVGTVLGGPAIAPAPAVEAAWVPLFADQAWYKGQAGQEQIFTGTLEAIPQAGGFSTLMRTSYYRLGDRTIYTGAKKLPALDKLVGQAVQIRGKGVEMDLEGQHLKEIWPGAIRAAQGGAADVPKPADFAGLLEAAAAGKAPLEAVRITAYDPANKIDLAAYGTGVGFLDGTQVRLTAEQIRGLLTTLVKAKFAEMPVRFGGLGNRFPGPIQPMLRGGPAIAPGQPEVAPGGPAIAPAPAGPMMPERLIRSLTVDLDGGHKTVTQLAGGEQSAEFETLIKDLAAAVRPLVEEGLAVKGLSWAEAVKALANGALAPEAVSLTITSNPRRGRPGVRWSMTVNQATVHLLSPQGMTQPTLARAEMEAVVKKIGAALSPYDPSKLPQQLYSADALVSLSLQIKGLEGLVRVSADMFPRNKQEAEAHPDAQKAFEALVATLKGIYDELQAKAPASPSPAFRRLPGPPTVVW